MSKKNVDAHGRWRSRTVAFRMSEEEVRQLDALVAMSGLTKQDYITARLLERDILVVPSTRVQRALEDVSLAILAELRRLDDAREVPGELRDVMSVFARTLEGLGMGSKMAIEAPVAFDIARMERGD